MRLVNVRHFISLALIFLFVISCTPSQRLDCSQFKMGTYHYRSRGLSYQILREKTVQTETNLINGNVTVYSINWINDCSYQLKMLTTTGYADELRKKATLTVEILNTTEYSYTYRATSDAIDRVLIDTLWTGEYVFDPATINDVSDSNLYFPLEKFTDSSSFKDSDKFMVETYSEKLRALREPVLYTKTQNYDVYRFTWLRTFHSPIAIRMERNNDQYTLTWKVSDGMGGYDPGQLILNKSIKIGKREWDNFEKLLEEISFWDLQTVEGGLSGLDGAQWIIEGYTDRGYHVVDRWTPREDSFGAAGKYLLSLTDLTIPKEDIY